MLGCLWLIKVILERGVLSMRKLEKIPVVASTILGTSTARAYEMARLGLIPVVRLGRQLRVDMDALEAWIKEGGKGLKDEQHQKNK